MAITLRNVELYGGEKSLIFKFFFKTFLEFYKNKTQILYLFYKQAVQTTLAQIIDWKIHDTILIIFWRR